MGKGWEAGPHLKRNLGIRFSKRNMKKESDSSNSSEGFLNADDTFEGFLNADDTFKAVELICDTLDNFFQQYFTTSSGSTNFIVFQF